MATGDGPLLSLLGLAVRPRCAPLSHRTTVLRYFHGRSARRVGNTRRRLGRASRKRPDGRSTCRDSSTNRTARPAPGREPSATRAAAAVGQPILTGSRAINATQPFVQRCANARVGNVNAKVLYLVAASYCNVYVDGESGLSLAARETLRRLAELGRHAFAEAWRHLVAGRLFIVQRRGQGKTSKVHVFAVAPLAVAGSQPKPRKRPNRARKLFQKDPPGDPSRRIPRGIHQEGSPGDPQPSLYRPLTERRLALVA